MCLAFKKSQRATRNVATKDIPIFKLVERKGDHYSAMYRETHIELGVMFKSILDEPRGATENSGFFLCDLDIRGLGNPSRYLCKFVSIGLHAFSDSPKLDDYIQWLSNDNTVFLKGRIPVGAEYYENKLTGLIVASAMIYDEEVYF